MTQYCGIIITDTEFYVSVSKRIQNKIKVIDRYIHKRTESLTIDLSTIHSKLSYYLLNSIYRRTTTYTKQNQQ